MGRLCSTSPFSIFLVVKRNLKAENLVFSTESVGFRNLALFTRRVSQVEDFSSCAEGNYQEKSWFLGNWCTGFHNKYLEWTHCPWVIENMGNVFTSAAVFESNPPHSHWVRWSS